jgi:hypothetical protein
VPELPDGPVLPALQDGPAAELLPWVACGYHRHPTAETSFHKSALSLHLWFYAMWLTTSTRCGVAATQPERELGVTYETVLRICP